MAQYEIKINDTVALAVKTRGYPAGTIGKIVQHVVTTLGEGYIVELQYGNVAVDRSELTVVPQPDLPLQMGDAVKLRVDQPIVYMGHPTRMTVWAGEKAAFISHVHGFGARPLAVIELADPMRGSMRVVVELSNLERV